jgi:3-hydroxyisobutyrate dehydrogenase-like beta-hydroxyacid dehydrogenase
MGEGGDVAFLCLGAMGRPMAGHLARAGHRIAVWNRTRSRAEAFVAEHGGRAAASPADAARGARFVYCCTADDDALRALALGPDGAFQGLAARALFVDHTTASPGLARELARAGAERGIAVLDAPVSGGEEGARRGALTIMAGGDADDFARAEPLLSAYAKSATLMGPHGAGQLTKLVNQICIAGVVEGLAEGLHFAGRAGLDLARVIDVVSQGAAGSWQMTNRARTMAEGRFDFGFAVDWMRKDLGFALAEARANGARLPQTALVDQLYAELQARGRGRLDTSSLITLLDGAPGSPPDRAPGRARGASGR